MTLFSSTINHQFPYFISPAGEYIRNQHLTQCRGGLMKNLQEVYRIASTLAFENAERWLEVAKAAFQMGYYGQARSLTITAYEEMGKAIVSWWAANGIVPFDDDLVHDVYRVHWVKTTISAMLHGILQIPLDLSFGFIEENEFLKEAVTMNKEKLLEVSMDLLEAAAEVEFKRREGMYVDVWEEDDGSFTVTSPSDITEDRTKNAIEEVEFVLKFSTSLFKFLDENPQELENYKTGVEEERRYFDDLPDTP